MPKQKTCATCKHYSSKLVRSTLTYHEIQEEFGREFAVVEEKKQCAMRCYDVHVEFICELHNPK